MTRPRQDCPPELLAVMLVALALVVLLGWRALTLESRQPVEPMTELAPSTEAK